jgi:hypothetical protein
VGGVDPGSSPDPGAITVAESRRQIGLLFGFGVLAFAVALARGVTGAHTTAGRAVTAVFCGVLIAAGIRGWVYCARHLARLEVTADAIRLVQRNGRASALSRQLCDELRFVRQHPGGPLSRVWTLGLAIAGTGSVVTLSGFFSRSQVRQACRARGWRFGSQDSGRLDIPAGSAADGGYSGR